MLSLNKARDTFLNKPKIIIFVCLILTLAGTGYIFRDVLPDLPFFTDSPPVEPLPPAVAKPQPAPKTVAQRQRQSPPLPQEAPAQNALTVPAGNLATLTFLRAELEEQTVREQIAEKKARLRKLQEETALSTSLVLPPAKVLADLPPGKVQESKRQQPQKPMIVSIHGINGSVAAMVQTAAGRRTLKKGDNFEGGKIDAITSAGIAVRTGANVHIIPVED